MKTWCDWIPAFAGMTGAVPTEAQHDLRWFLEGFLIL